MSREAWAGMIEGKRVNVGAIEREELPGVNRWVSVR